MKTELGEDDTHEAAGRRAFFFFFSAPGVGYKGNKTKSAATG